MWLLRLCWAQSWVTEVSCTSYSVLHMPILSMHRAFTLYCLFMVYWGNCEMHFGGICTFELGLQSLHLTNHYPAVVPWDSQVWDFPDSQSEGERVLSDSNVSGTLQHSCRLWEQLYSCTWAFRWFPHMSSNCPHPVKKNNTLDLWGDYSFDKIIHFHIQLHHLPDSKLYLLAAATTLITILRILLIQTFS
jgi:hypothetical protein